MTRRFTILLLMLLTILMRGHAQYTNVSDLPTIYIETFDGSAITSKTTYKYCRLHYVDEEGLLTSYDSVSIRGRGNSTWNLSKKPYRIKFLNKEKFLGKGYAKCKKWTLLANAGDKTMMRNAVTSAMGEFTSLKFNPAAKFVDMYLNGSYQGTYQISDQVDVRPHRVDITEQDYPLTEESDITGGYLLEVDGFKDGNCFTTTRYGAPVRIHYPDDEEIAAEQTNYIRNFVNRFEAVLGAQTFTDPVQGYRAMVDTMSLIDWYICTEVSANIDGFFSTYFYKEQGDDRLYWGPLWDYDIAYNNDQRVQSEQGVSSSVRLMMADIAYNGSKKWVNRMWEDPWFQKTVYHRYKDLLDEGLVSYMQEKVDSFATLLQQSQELNYEKWGISRKMYHEMVLYSSYDQYVADLKTFIVEHCAFLLEAFANRKPAEPTPPFTPANFYYRIVNSKTKKNIDIDAEGLAVQHADNPDNETQDWQFMAVGNSFQIVNRATGLALNDPTEGSNIPTTNVGEQLNTVTPDEHNPCQLWNIIPQGTDGYYNLENANSLHIANLNGGSTNEGTPILSYSSDQRNSSSQNRLWALVACHQLPQPEPVDTIPVEPIDTTTIEPIDTTTIEPVDSIPDEPIDVAVRSAIEPAEYALAYNPMTQELHFGAEQPELLTFPVRVFTAGGQLVATFHANERLSMNNRPAGIYIVNWTVGGKRRSVKFRK